MHTWTKSVHDNEWIFSKTATLSVLNENKYMKKRTISFLNTLESNGVQGAIAQVKT